MMSQANESIRESIAVIRFAERDGAFAKAPRRGGRRAGDGRAEALRCPAPGTRCAAASRRPGREAKGSGERELM